MAFPYTTPMPPFIVSRGVTQQWIFLALLYCLKFICGKRSSQKHTIQLNKYKFGKTDKPLTSSLQYLCKVKCYLNMNHGVAKFVVVILKHA